MKRIFSIIKGIFKLLERILCVIILLLIGTSIVNFVMVKSESKKYSAPGDLIEVYENEFIHAKMFGTGEYTILLQDGWGYPFPYYDLYDLAESLSTDYKVIIMEQLGYGYSSLTEKPRTLENYALEIDKVLNFYDIDRGIILMPHSYSGLIYQSYANNHPESVKGLVCLDCTTAYQIEDIKKQGEMPKMNSLISKLGLTRLAINTFNRESITTFRKEFRGPATYLASTKYLNKTVINENNALLNMLNALQNIKYRDDLVVTNILSSESMELSKTMLSVEWKTAHENLISNREIQSIHILEGTHQIYRGHTSDIKNIVDEVIGTIDSAR